MECGSCTLCCKLPFIKETDSKLNEWCDYCEPTTGCKVYTIRPEECRIYNCVWAQMEKVGIDLRPDRCRVIFEKISDNVILGIKDPDYKLRKRVLGQIGAFNKEGISVLIADVFTRKPFMYAAEGHDKHEVWAVVENRIKELTE